MKDEFEPKDGVFAIPPPKNMPKYNIAKLFEYCEQKGIEPKDLTKKEKKQFIIN